MRMNASQNIIQKIGKWPVQACRIFGTRPRLILDKGILDKGVSIGHDHIWTRPHATKKLSTGQGT